MEKRTDLITGIFKFKDSVPGDQMDAFAEELAKDDKYIHVYIRKVSKDQYGVGVAYKSADEVTEEVFDKYLEDMKDVIYRKFGAGLVGWDFSSSTRAFKGF